MTLCSDACYISEKTFYFSKLVVDVRSEAKRRVSGNVIDIREEDTEGGIILVGGSVLFCFRRNFFNHLVVRSEQFFVTVIHSRSSLSSSGNRGFFSSTS